MNKKTLLKSLNNIKPLLVAIVLLAGLSFVSAVPWGAPDAGSTNTKAPIDEGTPNQEKIGALTVGALTNSAHGPVVTFSPLSVGSSSLAVSSSFYGPLKLFGVFDSTANEDMPICTDSNGKVKLCSDKISFSPISNVYYSPTLTTSQTVTFPSGGVTGAITYNIDAAYSCTTVQAKDAITNNTTTDTTWPNGTTLTGSSSGYNVTFSRWGSFILGINCTNGKSYAVTIDIKGKIKPVFNSTQKFLFSSARTLEIKAIGGGGDGSRFDGKKTCYEQTTGGQAFAHATSSSSWSPNAVSSPSNIGPRYNSGANVIHAGGGYTTSSCYDNALGGDYKTYGSGTYSVTTRNGNWFCPGSNPTSCSQQDDGAGGDGYRSGGGGAYVSLKYDIAQNDYLHVWNSDTTDGNPTGGAAARPASLIVEWK